MEKPKKQKNEPEVEINWDIIERQYGEITARPIPDEAQPHMLQLQEPEDPLLLLSRELDFGNDEVKANSIGKLTLRQRRKLAQLHASAYIRRSFVFCMVSGLLALVLANILGLQIDFFLITVFALVIGLWFSLRWRELLYRPVTVHHRKAYLVAYPCLGGYMLIASDEPDYRSSSWEITIPVSEKLYIAFEENTELYHIYYTSETKTVLSVERVEETVLNPDLS